MRCSVIVFRGLSGRTQLLPGSLDLTDHNQRRLANAQQLSRKLGGPTGPGSLHTMQVVRLPRRLFRGLRGVTVGSLRLEIAACRLLGRGDGWV